MKSLSLALVLSALLFNLSDIIATCRESYDWYDNVVDPDRSSDGSPEIQPNVAL